ncbi:hypothetical protein [Streptomyces humi]|uniref:hypothetical protein n=1 Tax=Streptomyces humi TaxID=1428620 RepID=UPI00142DF6B2|nr:hypothetical protein [Streptomyces humi]
MPMDVSKVAWGEVCVGVPAVLWGARRRSVPWVLAGAVLLVHGVLELSYETVFPRD